MALYDNLFIKDRGDGVQIHPHHDGPRGMVISSNRVRVLGTPYRQGVIAHAGATGGPLHGGDRTHPVTWVYRRGWVSTPVLRLTGWRRAVTGGVKDVSPALLRAMGGMLP